MRTPFSPRMSTIYKMPQWASPQGALRGGHAGAGVDSGVLEPLSR
ncbi:hypothetical protein [Mycolicibacterium anyangense]|nr:hypothetical protein [Mycolicibacterium anyangense]